MNPYILIEKNKEKNVGPIFGPFKTHAEAAEFGHRRIAMFCSEWQVPEDGFLCEHLSWEIRQLSAFK